MKKTIFRICYVVLVIGLFAAAGISLFVLPQKDFSENENRYLTKLPKVTWTDVKEGTVQKNLDKASQDQFVQRDRWMELATELNKAMGNKCINGVYLGKDKYYFEQVLDSEIAMKKYGTNLAILQKISDETEGSLTTMLVPSPGQVLKDKLPKDAVLYHDDVLYEMGEEELRNDWLGIKEQLEKASKKEQVYFRTDHHWTLQGAYEAYKAYEGKMGREAVPYAQFEPRIASDRFLGTMYSKVLERNPKADTLYIPINLPKNLQITIDGKEKESIYEESKLNTKDKYAVFFGGNYGKIQIENKEAATKDTLIVVKDSFANSLVPFLLQDYKKIIMIDLRYYNLSMQQLLKEEAGADILVLYELSNFVEEGNMHKMLQ